MIKPHFIPDWQWFTRRKDNIGLPILEVKRKFLVEQNLYDFNIFQLNALASGGRTKSKEIEPQGFTLNEGYTLADNAKQVGYWYNFNLTSLTIENNPYPVTTGQGAGIMYETTATNGKPTSQLELFVDAPPFPGGPTYPIFITDTTQEVVALRRFYSGRGGEQIGTFLPKALGYDINWDFTAFEPYFGSSFDVESIAGFNSPITTLPSMAFTSTEVDSQIEKVQVNITEWDDIGTLGEVDWTKVLRADKRLIAPTVVLDPGIDTNIIALSYDGASPEMAYDETRWNWDNAPLKLEYVPQSRIGNYENMTEPGWVLHTDLLGPNYLTLAIFGPTKFEDLWGIEGQDWAPGSVISVG